MVRFERQDIRTSASFLGDARLFTAENPIIKLEIKTFPIADVANRT